MFHKKYWRKGDEGWNEIRKSGKIDIPPLDDPDTLEVSLGHTRISIWGLISWIFFDGMDSILVRDEYEATLGHLVKLSEIRT